MGDAVPARAPSTSRERCPALPAHSQPLLDHDRRDDDEAVAEYMTAVLDANDPDLLLLALGDVARARGMAQIAKDAGLGRESLYKALAPGAKPRFETVMKVAKALGVKFKAQAA
jgi:probable addiction module antidote protein